MKEEVLKEILSELKILNKDKSKVLEQLKTLDKPIWVKSGKAKKLIRINEINFITTNNKKIEVNTNDGNVYITKDSITKITEEFKNDPRIFRCHKSYIVNLNNISEVKVIGTGRELSFSGTDKKAKVSYDLVSKLEKLLGKI